MDAGLTQGRKTERKDPSLLIKGTKTTRENNKNMSRFSMLADMEGALERPNWLVVKNLK